MATRSRTPNEPNGDDLGDGDAPRTPTMAEWRQSVGLPAVTGDIDDDELIEETPADRISRMLVSVGQDERASVRLYRVTPNTQKMTWCCNYTPAEFEAGDLELIRNQWGAGDYQIRVYAALPGGGFGLRSKADISIAASLVPMNSAAASNAGFSPEIAAMMKGLADGQAQLIAAIAQRPDPTAQMMQTFAMMKEMREAMGIGSNPAPAPAPVSPMQTMMDSLAMIRALKEAASEIAPPKDDAPDPDNPMALAGQVIGMVQSAMANRPQAPQIGVASVAVPAAIAGVSSGVTELPAMPDAERAENPIQTETDDMNLMQVLTLRGYVSELVKRAVKGEDPSTAAEFVFEKAPDALIDFLQTPEWFALLCQFAPECEPHADWFAKVHAEVLRLIDADSTDAG